MTDERDDEDAKLILSRRQLLVAGAISGVTLVASASAQPGPCLSAPVRHVSFSRAPGRRSTPPDRIPAVIRDQLAHASIYAAGGGLTSAPWRIVVMLDNATLTAAEGTEPGGASYGPLPITWGTRVREPSLRGIVVLADRAWREQRSPNPHPTADYDEVLAMRDGDEHFFAQGFGPLRGGAVEELIARLRAAASAARPAR